MARNLAGRLNKLFPPNLVRPLQYADVAAAEARLATRRAQWREWVTGQSPLSPERYEGMDEDIALWRRYELQFTTEYELESRRRRVLDKLDRIARNLRANGGKNEG